MRRHMIRIVGGRADSTATRDSRSFAREALAPFHDLLADIEAIANGDVYHPIAAEGPPEVVTIAIAANRMRVSLLNRDRAPARSTDDDALQQLCRLGASLHTTARRNPSLAEGLRPLIDETDQAIRTLRAADAEARGRRPNGEPR
jgi:methyl-accepting chemotaxis protein